MTYRCLGGSLYQIQLTIFRDCENGFPQAYFDDPVPIGIFAGGNGALLSTEYIPWSGIDDTLDLTLANPCLWYLQCLYPHDNLFNSSQFAFPSWRLPLSLSTVLARNNIINNIIDPSTTGATYDVFISDQALATCNSSPRFLIGLLLHLSRSTDQLQQFRCRYRWGFNRL